MKKYWSPRIKDQTPYIPGEQPREGVFIKLNTNENPYPPSPKVIEAIRAAAGDNLRLYPDPTCMALRTAIANHCGVTPNQVFAGNGSDEVLAFSFQAFFDPAKRMHIPDITYVFYHIYASFFGLQYNSVPLNEDLSLPVEAFYNSPGGVIIANPNAPSGQTISLDDIRGILEHNRDVVVIVDEAYVNFGGISAIPLVAEYDNLLVIQTLSKSRSLAGLRVGFAVGHPDLIAGLCCVRDCINSYTLDQLAAAGAVAAIEDTEYLEANVAKICATRQWVVEKVRSLGFQLPNPTTNFLFMSHPTIPAATLLQQLRERNILVRHFNRPRIDNCLRVTIGTDEEMRAFCDALEELVR